MSPERKRQSFPSGLCPFPTVSWPREQNPTFWKVEPSLVESNRSGHYGVHPIYDFLSGGAAQDVVFFSALKDDDRLPRLARFEQLFLCLCVSGPDKLSDRT